MYTILNQKLTDFNTLERKIYEWACWIARYFMKLILESVDDEIARKRDRSAYRDKGKRNTTVKTVFGEVEYKRRAYLTTLDDGSRALVYLLDKELGLETVGTISANLAEKIAEAAAEMPYRDAARQISETTGQTISAQGAWGVVQKVGERISDALHADAAAAKQEAPAGTEEAPVLFEEMDGVYVKGQGPHHEKAKGVEIKAFTMYSGWSSETRLPEDKRVMATVCGASEFHKLREGFIESTYDPLLIGTRVLNGDGGSWINEDEESVFQLDRFHVQKAITKGIKDKDAAKEVKDRLSGGDVDGALEYISIYADSVASPDPKDKKAQDALDLLAYLENNKNGLKPWQEQMDKVPEPPEGITYDAGMGIQESTNCGLLTMRMKHRRMRWSEDGAAHMALLLSSRANGELNDTIEKMAKGELPDNLALLTEEKLSAARISETVGKGSAYPDAIAATMPLLGSARTASLNAMLSGIIGL